MILDRIARRRLRAKARWASRELDDKTREVADGIFARIWNTTKDVAEAKAQLEAELEKDEYGFDPATVIMLIRLGVLIFEILKSLGYLAVTAEQLSAMLEIEVEDPS